MKAYAAMRGPGAGQDDDPLAGCIRHVGGLGVEDSSPEATRYEYPLLNFSCCLIEAESWKRKQTNLNRMVVVMLPTLNYAIEVVATITTSFQSQSREISIAGNR